MVIGDEDGTCLDRGVDPVLKEWRLTAGGAGEPPAKRGGTGGGDVVWICAHDGEERRGKSGGGVQVGFKPMTLHCLSSSPAGSADFSGCYPLLSPTSFNWQLQSDGATGGLAAGMECEQQQFEDFFSSPEKIGAGAEEKERGVTVPAAAAAAESLEALCRRRALWRRDFGAPSEWGPRPVKIGVHIEAGVFRPAPIFSDTGPYWGPAGDALRMTQTGPMHLDSTNFGLHCVLEMQDVQSCDYL
jgi:hypothetical protein